ncbi:peptidoglycan DD-metalloendopeptidase family protein [Marinicrinis sediminis]|uniref:Peptidoglycan DD-metalloendopeptidase family protein n=1 Tax=Marinicrinis sediminis TaxID=1652465 RepID=A0ABW5RAV3_9BACL
MNWMNKGKGWMKSILPKRKLNTNRAHDPNVEALNVQHVEPSKTAPSKWSAYKLRIGATAGALTILAGATYAGHEYVEANMNEVYEVYFQDELIGVASSEEKVLNHVEEVVDTVQSEHADVKLAFNDDGIDFKSERAFMAESDDALVLEKLEELIEPQAFGVELVVGDKVVGVFKTKAEANQVLESLKAKFTPASKPEAASDVKVLSASAEASGSQSADTGKTVNKLESVDFVEPVSVKEVEIDADKLDQPDILFSDSEQVKQKLETGNVKPVKYVVQEGDSISAIASRFDISKQVIYENNAWIVNDMIRVGDELDLTVLQPGLSVKTVETTQEVQEIQYQTQYEYDDNMKMGKTKVVQQGKDGKKLMTFRLTSVNGNLMEEELVGEEILVESVPAVIVKGTKVIKGEGTGNFAWPVKGGTLTSSYGMRWGSMHKGIDMVSKDKTILAADSGEVTFAGKKSGYGNAVIIDHKNGYQTLYAHLNKVSVSAGTKVEKGEQVGVMGNTGNSTGVHLHFEILKNGSYTNPLTYLN